MQHTFQFLGLRKNRGQVSSQVKRFIRFFTRFAPRNF